MCLMGGEGAFAVKGRGSRASALSSVGKGPGNPFSISMEQTPAHWAGPERLLMAVHAQQQGWYLGLNRVNWRKGRGGEASKH